MLEKEFVPYPESLDMKELGFDEPCIAVRHRDGTLCSIVPEFTRDSQVEGFEVIRNSECLWENDEDSINGIQEVATPTFSQAFRWFREKHDLQCWVEPTGSDRYSCRYDGNDKTGYRWVGYLRNIDNEILFYLTYKEAELSCIRKLIVIVKNKQQ